jgi:uncharacterized membrane protein YphA (DoxX/SURF4 family)
MNSLSRWTSWFLGALFLATGTDKLFHYGGFVKALGSYAVVPAGLAHILAPSLILCELLVGASLFLRAWRRSAAVTAAALLALFTVALAVNYRLAPGAVCGCWFTVTLGRATGLHLLQNLLLLGLAVTLAVEPPLPRRAPSVGAP